MNSAKPASPWLDKPLARAPRQRKGGRVARAASSSARIRPLAQQRANHLLDQQRARVDAIEIAPVVIITVTGVEVVARAQAVRDLSVSIPRAVAEVIALADIEEF